MSPLDKCVALVHGELPQTFNFIFNKIESIVKEIVRHVVWIREARARIEYIPQLFAYVERQRVQRWQLHQYKSV